MRRLTVIILTLIFFITVPALSQDEEKEKAKLLDAPPLDFSVPESPAFTMLGVTPQDVAKPPDAEGLGVALLNATDQNGVLQSGIAIDTNPYLVFRGPTLTIEDYQDKYWQQFLSRTKLSVATTKASGDAKDTRGAAGLLFVPIDTADPRLDKKLGDCLTTALSFEGPPVPPDPQNHASDVEPLDKTIQKKLLECHEEFTKRKKTNWNASSWMIGIAAASVTDDGKVESLHGDGVGIWTSYSRQFAFGRETQSQAPKSDVRRAQVIVHGRYRTSEKVKPEGSDTEIDQDSMLLGARLRLGAPEFGGSVEVSHIRKEPDEGNADSHFRVLIGAERLIFGSTWLQIAVGRDVGREEGDDLVIRSAFRWSFSQKRKFE